MLPKLRDLACVLVANCSARTCDFYKFQKGTQAERQPASPTILTWALTIGWAFRPSRPAHSMAQYTCTSRQIPESWETGCCNRTSEPCATFGKPRLAWRHCQAPAISGSANVWRRQSRSQAFVALTSLTRL